LIPVEKKSKKPKKKRPLKVDINSRISSESMKAALADYSDLLRCENPGSDLVDDALLRLDNTGGRRLGLQLSRFFFSSIVAAKSSLPTSFDFEVPTPDVETPENSFNIPSNIAESTRLSQLGADSQEGNEALPTIMEDEVFMPALPAADQGSYLGEIEPEREKHSRIEESIDISTNPAPLEKENVVDIPSPRLSNVQPLLNIPEEAHPVISDDHLNQEAEASQDFRGPLVNVDDENIIDLEASHGVDGQPQEMEHENLETNFREISLNDVYSRIIECFPDELPVDHTTFSVLCPPQSTKVSEASLNFLRVLELEKKKVVRTSQEEAFGEIQIFLES